MHLFFLLMAVCCVSTAGGLMFDLTHIGPQNQNKDIVVEGTGSYISAEGLYLAVPVSEETTTPPSAPTRTITGRASYAELLRLYDRGSGEHADFTTTFSLSMDSAGRTGYGEGISFFLARNSSLVNTSGAMGLPVVVDASNNVTSSSPFVAVEFDTHWNLGIDPVDGRDQPIGEHVGIDINSLVSVKSRKWFSNISQGEECDVNVRYDSASLNLSVSFTSFHKNTIPAIQFEVHHRVDLRRVLPEWVLFGFAASSSGDHFQRNIVKSWYFQSTDFNDGKSRRKKIDWKTVGLCFAVVALVILLILSCVLLRKNKKPEPTPNSQGDQTGVTFNSCSPQAFTYEDLRRATNDFHDTEKLGEGGFGAVYRAVLSDGKMAAVKRISRTSEQGTKEYEAEVKIVSRSRHKHLVQLFGWCHEIEGQFLLVYELMVNGSLDSHLFDQQRAPLLGWGLRCEIALGMAKGLHYLHEGCEQLVLHRDIKASNVLLDSNFKAKLGDFGLARLLDDDQSFARTVVAGTPGYLDPEYLTTHEARPASDVYSFGIVLLEIATGRKCKDKVDPENQMVLLQWVRDLDSKNRILDAADPILGGNYDVAQMKLLLELGLSCCDADFRLRPRMEKVVETLGKKPPLSVIKDKISGFFSRQVSPVTAPLPASSSTSTAPFETQEDSPNGPQPLPPIPESSSNPSSSLLVGPRSTSLQEKKITPAKIKKLMSF